MLATSAVELIRREMRISYGPVPDTLNGITVDLGKQIIESDRYLLRTTVGIDYYYRKGEGVTIQRSPQSTSIEEELYLNGSVYSAVACINRLYPLHASAVVFEGKVYAFSGNPGAGKSTLAAALGQQGFTLFCDDTMILDLSDPARPIALPGHKRLKLTPQAITMLGGIAPLEKVDDSVDKFYVNPVSGTFDQPLPIGQLLYLAHSPNCEVSPLRGGARLASVNDDHYTGWLYARANRLPAAQWFAFQAQLAKSLPMSRFARPFDPLRFDNGVAFIAAKIRERHFA